MVGLGTKPTLLEELIRIDESEGRLAQEKGRTLLAAAETHLEEMGQADVTLAHRHVGIVETIIEHEAEAELVVIG